MSALLALVGMEGHVWMKKMDFTASVQRVLSPLTVTPRWMSVAAALVFMVHAGMTSTVIAVTVNLDGWERIVIWTGMTVCQVPARMLAHALTSSMVSPANVAKASEVTSAK